MSAPEPPTRAFLDANILYAAAIGGGVARLWSCARVVLVTSDDAVNEVFVNLRDHARSDSDRTERLELLEALVARTELFVQPVSPWPFAEWDLPDLDDVPILTGAIDSGCAFLVTGDKRCFGKHFGSTLGGVTVLTPAQFLQRFP
ncbi:MAG TPA: hypothetical protein DEB06_05875 [Phycisphaerales bacterium]|nr:hypothetical protein [Phycisphaerales bacterium]